MLKKESPILEYAILAVILFIAAVFYFNFKNQEVILCRKAFSGLIKESRSVEKLIDWDHLQALGVDVGATYVGLANQKERENYRKAFFQSFSRGFQLSKAKLSEFTNWRVVEKGGQDIIVAADYSGYNKTLLFGVNKTGKKRLLWITWKQ